MNERKGLVTMGGKPVTLLGPALQVGDRAPEFVAINHEADALGDQVKVITVSMDLPFAQKRWRRPRGSPISRPSPITATPTSAKSTGC